MMRRLSAVGLIVVAALALSLNAAAQPPSLPVQAFQVVVFKAGDLGYNCFRIPILLAVPGALLAFVEARVETCSDYHAHSILVKRSTDNGVTWSKAILVSNVTKPGTLKYADGLNLGVAVYQPPGEARPERIWLSWVECFHRCIVPYQYVQSSADLGLTWDPPRDITQSIMALSKFSPGPGYGVHLTGFDEDRLVICGHYTRSESQENAAEVLTGEGVVETEDRPPAPVQDDAGTIGAACIYSDDLGGTWRSGVPVPYNSSLMSPRECQPVTTGYNGLLMTMRDGSNSHHPLWSYSYDGGISWGDAYTQVNLTTATCDASMAVYNESGNIHLIFSGPVESDRSLMEVHYSSDRTGAKWLLLSTLWYGPAAYSCLAVLPEQSVGVLYENGNHSPYEMITFARALLPGPAPPAETETN